MLCLLPLAAVALYGLGLRVGQYGWTIPRVWALYCGGLLALYALGYAAALRPAGFYGTLATTNLVAAFATLVLLALVHTPWPTRAASPRKASCRACWTAAWNRANTATAACATTTAAGARCPAPAGRRRRQQARSAHRTGGGERADRQVLLLGRTQDRPDRRVAHL